MLMLLQKEHKSIPNSRKEGFVCLLNAIEKLVPLISESAIWPSVFSYTSPPTHCIGGVML